MCPTTGELLQLQQTNPDGSDNFATPTVSPTESSFRHSGWQHRRTRIAAALAQTGNYYRRLDRFNNCGACAVIEQSPTTKKYRVTCWHCKDRMCTPCQQRKTREIRQLIMQNVGENASRFVTLTLDHRDEPLKDALARLREGFTKLRKSKFWRSVTIGGLVVVEVKIGDDKKWHPHLHAVVTGGWIAQNELSREWQKATGTAKIVDVRLVRREQAVIGYISKYVSKPIDSTVLHDDACLVEYIIAMKGVRTYAVFGNWKPLEDRPDADDPGDWSPVCSVKEFWTAYEEAEPWAIAMAEGLRYRHLRDDAPLNAAPSAYSG